MQQIIDTLNRMTQKKRNVFFLFLFFSLIFFLQFPVQNSLVGDIDTIYNLALYHQMKNFIDLHLFGVDTGLLCYPTDFGFGKQAWVNFGANYGIGLIHVLFNYIGMSDLWAHWLFMSILFTANTFALYLLVNKMYKQIFVCMAIALIFNYAHFTLANLDNINSVVFFISYLALYYYKMYADSLPEKAITKYFYVSVFLGALQIYLSPYNFVIHTIIWALFILFFEFKYINWASIKRFAIGLVFYSAIIFPYMYVFFITDMATREHNVYLTENFIHVTSLNVNDLYRVLKNHLYLSSEMMLESPLLSKIRAAYLGVALYILAIIGLFRKQYRTLGILIVVIGFVISIGPFVSIYNMRQYPSFIMHPIYELFDMYDTISVPVRFFFICVFGLCILAANGLIVITEKVKSPIVPILIVFIILLENIPLKMEVYDHRFLLNLPDSVKKELSEGTDDVIYHMPSSLVEMNANYRREYVYMYWQHFHKQNTVNCFPPFMPGNRKKIDTQLVNFNQTTFSNVIEKNGFDKIVFNIELVRSSEEGAQLNKLYSFPFLEPVLESDKTIIFRVDKSKL